MSEALLRQGLLAMRMQIDALLALPVGGVAPAVVAPPAREVVAPVSAAKVLTPSCAHPESKREYFRGFGASNSNAWRCSCGHRGED